MEFGIQLANLELARFRALSQAAEQVGYSLICFPDHFVSEGPERSYDPHTVLYDSVVLAAVVAEATKTIKVGHLVLCNLFRHPAVTALSLRHKNSGLERFSGGTNQGRFSRRSSQRDQDGRATGNGAASLCRDDTSMSHARPRARRRNLRSLERRAAKRRAIEMSAR